MKSHLNIISSTFDENYRLDPCVQEAKSSIEKTVKNSTKVVEVTQQENLQSDETLSTAEDKCINSTHKMYVLKPSLSAFVLIEIPSIIKMKNKERIFYKFDKKGNLRILPTNLIKSMNCGLRVILEKAKMQLEEEISEDETTKSAPKTKMKASKVIKMNADKDAVDRLLTSNVFRDAAGNHEGPDHPVFTSTRKDDALEELRPHSCNGDDPTALKDWRLFKNAVHSFDGHTSLTPDGNGQWKLRGLKTSLRHYQVMGVAFMRDRESSNLLPQGGLQADIMGMGSKF